MKMITKNRSHKQNINRPKVIDICNLYTKYNVSFLMSI